MPAQRARRRAALAVAASAAPRPARPAARRRSGPGRARRAGRRARSRGRRRRARRRRPRGRRARSGGRRAARCAGWRRRGGARRAGASARRRQPGEQRGGGVPRSRGARGRSRRAAATSRSASRRVEAPGGAADAACSAASAAPSRCSARDQLADAVEPLAGQRLERERVVAWPRSRAAAAGAGRRPDRRGARPRVARALALGGVPVQLHVGQHAAALVEARGGGGALGRVGDQPRWRATGWPTRRSSACERPSSSHSAFRRRSLGNGQNTVSSSAACSTPGRPGGTAAPRRAVDALAAPGEGPPGDGVGAPVGLDPVGDAQAVADAVLGVDALARRSAPNSAAIRRRSSSSASRCGTAGSGATRSQRPQHRDEAGVLAGRTALTTGASSSSP